MFVSKRGWDISFQFECFAPGQERPMRFNGSTSLYTR
jgi:hypothetical protein